MKENLEKEFKSKIKKKDYLRLIEKYNLEAQIYWQINYYFDDKNLTLKENNKTLRIRQKEKTTYITLKEKASDGTIEKSFKININTLIKMCECITFIQIILIQIQLQIIKTM